MKTRFLCLLALVTVMISYAPLARANEALRFDSSSRDALPAATESNIWMATDPTAHERSDATVTATNERTESLPMAIAPNSRISELPVKPANKLGAAINKEVPAQPALSFAEPPSSVKKSVPQSASVVETVPAQTPPVQAALIQALPPQVTPPQSEPIQAAPARPPQPAARPIELGFSLSPTEPLYEPEQEMPRVSATPQRDEDPAAGMMADGLFTGNTNSLVARAVGSAEGTRTPEGDRTRAYYGHTDPGNRVWNQGSFSYQHSAQSPEDADQKQLFRLAAQAKIIEAKASSYGLELTLEEKLNGIDLANQAPKAALDRGGYVDWLAQARQRGMSGADAILWSRTQSFINPDTQRWDAPGLGNTAEGIRHDQARRMAAIDRAIAANQNAVNQAVKAASLPVPTAVKTASLPSTSLSSEPAVKSAQQVQPVPAPSVSVDPGIAQLLAEKIVELFGGDYIPADSTPVASESVGIQQLLGFAL